MKLEVLLTYDDKRKTVGNQPVKYHRNYIGVETNMESSIRAHIFPNPSIWDEMIICFKKKENSIVALARLEGGEQLVAVNKKSLTKLGQLLVDTGIEERIQEIYDGEGIASPIVKYLKPEHFAKFEFDYSDDKISFVSGTVKLMHPNFPNGLGLKPKVELAL